MKKFFLLIVVLCNSATASGESFGRGGISFNYPGVGMRYVFKKNIVELKYQKVKDDYETTLYGLRYYRLLHLKNIFPYFGGELGIFNTSETKGVEDASGRAVGVFIGVEKFIFKKFSVNMDIGPYIAVVDKPGKNSISVNEFDFVLNISINFYFLKNK
ncbi:MAG: hypothetical protein NZ928_02465 [Endomicrobia bacterium]|nr:hypothetical protein [Endomicrobiia bacterium]